MVPRRACIDEGSRLAQNYRAEVTFDPVFL